MAEGRVTCVTGATGFVGSHLVESLAASGEQVRCLVRAESRMRWLPRGIEKVTVNSADPDLMARAVEGACMIYHLAAATSAVNSDGYRLANTQFTQSLVAAVRQSAPRARVVLCSTLAAGGPTRNGHPLTGAEPAAPIGPYGASKLEAERTLAASGLEHVIVRPPAVYGPRDRDILQVFRFAQRGVVPSFAPPGQLLSLVHVYDLASGLRLAGLLGAPGALYYLTDGPPHSWGEIVAAMGVAVQRQVRFIRLPLALGSAAARISCTVARITSSKPLLTPERIGNMAEASWTCDDTRARTELGYQPVVSLEEGMKQTASWYREEGWL